MKLMGVITSAIGAEVKRKEVITALKKSDRRYESPVESSTDFFYAVRFEKRQPRGHARQAWVQYRDRLHAGRVWCQSTPAVQIICKYDRHAKTENIATIIAVSPQSLLNVVS
jgi:hypothetical protein